VAERMMLDLSTATKLLIMAANDRGVAERAIARGRVTAVTQHPTDSQRMQCVSIDPLRPALLRAAGLRIWAEKELPHKLLVQVSNTTLRHVEVFPMAFQVKILQELPLGHPLRGALRSEVGVLNAQLGLLHEEEMREHLREGGIAPGLALEDEAHARWVAVARSGTNYFASFAMALIDAGLSSFVVPTLSLSNILLDPATARPILAGCAMSISAFSLYYRVAPYLTRVCDEPLDNQELPPLFASYLEE